MKIVVLDGFTLNPGDLSWDGLRELGECEIFERTTGSELLQRSSKADILITNKTELTRQHQEQLPNLKYIGITATGTNVVDIEASRDHGIIVTNAPAYGTASVAQTTIALLLELTQRAGYHSETVRQGRWSTNPDWCYWDYPLMELDSLTMGIVGFGRIGRAVSGLASAFGMKILATSSHPKAGATGVSFVGLETLFRQSDVVTLHCPLTAETTGLVNSLRLSWMKPGAILLNTARGALVDEIALAGALNSGRLAGAGLDVLSSEPPSVNNPLLLAKNCIITPHMAWGTLAARARLMRIVAENVQSFLLGRTQNRVA